MLFFVLQPLTGTAKEKITTVVKETKEGETIVILGKVPRPIEDVFGAASVISRETIDKQLVHDISDLIRYQAGISVENNGTRFGYSGFNIRGIGGNRVATEIDGIPVADQFGIGSYSNSGRNFIDVDLIQQVEILRGPASSTYGSNAIGGVVSFISKKPLDLLSQTDNDFYVGMKSGFYGVDNSRRLSVNTAYANGQSSALISISNTDGHELDSKTKAEVISDQQDYQTSSLLAKYYYDLSNNEQLSLSIDYFNRKSETKVNSVLGLGRFRSTTGLFGDDESKKLAVALSYEFESDLNWLEGGVVRVYHQNSETEQFTDETRFTRGTNYAYDRDFFYKQEVEGVRLNLYTNVSMTSLEHRIGYGLEWSNKKITELRNGLQTNLDTSTSTNVILSEQFPLRDFPISKIEETGYYINDEIEIIGTNLSLIPAIRYDQYQLSPLEDAIYLEDNPSTNIISIRESKFTPKFGIQYNMEDNKRLFLQYFEGFRAPPFEDANIGLDIPLFNIRAIPNPDLKSETSAGFELGYRVSAAQHSFDWIGFYTKYDNFIQTKVNLGFDPVSGRVLFQSQNINSAKIYGSELQYSFRISDWFIKDDKIKAYANIFWSKGENGDTKQALNNIEPNHALLGLNWNSAKQNLTLALHLSLYSEKSDVETFVDPTKVLFQTSGYGILDFIVNYQFSDSTSVSAAIYNIGDRRYWRWSDVEGLTVDDPLIDTLTASGINAALQLRVEL